jgi:hypothetical protein
MAVLIACRLPPGSEAALHMMARNMRAEIVPAEKWLH